MLKKANVFSTDNFFKKTFIFGLVAAVWGGMNVSSASAQALDEIVVTAQKREESLQEVAAAVSAYSSDFLEERQMSSISGLEKYTPNLRITNAPNNGTAAQVAIRGGVTINPAITWETTVGMYLNGVYIGKTQGGIFDVADVERMEVLRGPQGTLYGRNTLAGAINVVTKKPSDESGISAEIGIGNYNRKHTKLNLDIGQTGKLRTKISAYMLDRDGVVESTGPDGDLEDKDQVSALAAFSYDITDNVVIDYTYDYSNITQNPPYSQTVRVSAGNIFDPTSPLYAFGGAFFPLDQYVFADRQENVQLDNNVHEKSKIKGHSLTIEAELDNAVFKSITGIRDMEWSDVLDLDGSPLFIAHTSRFTDFESKSQEFQLVGSRGDINYVLGAYYYSDDAYTNNPQQYFGGGSSFDSQYGSETEAYAVYAQLDYPLTDQLTIKGGLRYTDEEKNIVRTSIALASADPATITACANTFPCTFIPAGTTASTEFDDVSPELAFEYAYNDDINLYARFAKGFKSGGFNGEAATFAETTTPYDAEEVNSFEIGAKMRLMEDRLQLNTALFTNEHEDMQLSIFTAQGAAASNVRNAGQATISGLEIEALFMANERLMMRLSYGYLDAEYDEFLELGADVANNRALPHTPENTLGIGFDADLMNGANGSLKLNVDYSYVDDYFTYPYALVGVDAGGTNAYNTLVDSYGTVDAQLIWSDLPFGNDSMKLTLWGKNIGDEEYINNYIDFGPGFGGITLGYFGEPVTYGLTASMSW